jgi:hypothetical protein
VSQRQYRGKGSRPIPVWNGVLEHRRRINAAIWEFLWLLDAITEERNSVGIVLGGAPVKASRIAADLNLDGKTVLRHLELLEEKKYIRRRRTAYGHVFEVCNSRKFGIWSPSKRSDKNVLSGGERSDKNESQIGQNCPNRSDKNVTNKEDAAVDAAKNAASMPLCLVPGRKDSVWDFLDISPCGPMPFRSLLEDGWKTKNGQRASEVIGRAVDAWEGTQGEKPPRCGRLFRALVNLRLSERQASQPIAETSAPIHTFSPEEIPA